MDSLTINSSRWDRARSSLKGDVIRNNLMLLISVALVASSFPVAANITELASPVATTAFRFILAALLFFPLVYQQLGKSIDIKMAAKFLLISGTLVGYFLGMFEALRYTTAINTSAFFTLVPLIGVGLSFLWLKLRTSLVMIAGFVIGTLGSLWVLFTGQGLSPLSMEFNRGDAIFLVACVSMAAHVTLSKKWLGHLAPKVATFWILVFGSLLLLPFVFYQKELNSIPWANVSFWVQLVYLSIFTTLLTFFLQQYTVQKLGPAKVLAYSFLIPAFVAIPTNIATHQERLVYLLPGLLVILGAIYIIQKNRTQPATGG